jgi:hypothetical protein
VAQSEGGREGAAKSQTDRRKRTTETGGQVGGWMFMHYTLYAHAIIYYTRIPLYNIYA